MGQDVDVELDDFFRYLATMPHHFADFKKDPEAVMRRSKLSDMAKSILRGTGKEGAIQQVLDKKEQILSAPESKKESNFNRDRSVPGYGGTVVKKEPSE
jgi:hypothetical protein